MAPFSARLEAFIGRRLIKQRGRDAKLLTRANAALKNISPTLAVSSPLGPSESPLLPEHTPLADNRFPTLSWTLPSDVDPAQVHSYLLVVEDPDAPLPSPVVHGLYYGLPAEKTSVGPDDFVPANGGQGDDLAGGFRYGANRMKSVWGGPRPVLAHGSHRYFFQVIALKNDLSAGGGDKLLSKKQLLKALVDDNVLAWGEWVGTFERQLE